MKRLLTLLFAAAAVMGLSGFAEPDRYAAGQVWEYRTRPGDEGSLLKIQRIETIPGHKAEPIYHISVIRFRVLNAETEPVLEHSPVSRQTLNASVTQLGDQTVEFPDPSNGIALWKADNGGVFTISVAEIIALIDEQTSGR
jgi:nitrogen fixation protein FixH